MKIHKFSYRNAAVEWELEPVEFKDLTLLVGVSGAGKTQILQALLDVKKIAEGKARNGVSWNIEFTASDGNIYTWEGEFELKEPYREPIPELEEGGDSPLRDLPRIKNERLERADDEVVTRKDGHITLLGNPTPKLSPNSSALSIFSEEDTVFHARRSFCRIVQSDISRIPYRFIGFSVFQKFADSFESIESVKESEHDLQTKLSVVYSRFPKVFAEIKDQFVETFPNVTDLRLEPIDKQEQSGHLAQTPIIQIRERGVSKWIYQHKISSGMLRTLFHIAHLYLSPKGTVILIDEFENSLGVNCIDVVTDDLLTQEIDLQFIITSHHPYIINNVGPKYWKVVLRDGGKVYTKDASEIGLSDSSHKAFIQLINCEQYREGIRQAQ